MRIGIISQFSFFVFIKNEIILTFMDIIDIVSEQITPKIKKYVLPTSRNGRENCWTSVHIF